MNNYVCLHFHTNYVMCFSPIIRVDEVDQMFLERSYFQISYHLFYFQFHELASIILILGMLILKWTKFLGKIIQKQFPLIFISIPGNRHHNYGISLGYSLWIEPKLFKKIYLRNIFYTCFFPQLQESPTTTPILGMLTLRRGGCYVAPLSLDHRGRPERCLLRRVEWRDLSTSWTQLIKVRNLEEGGNVDVQMGLLFYVMISYWWSVFTLMVSWMVARSHWHNIIF